MTVVHNNHEPRDHRREGATAGAMSVGPLPPGVPAAGVPRQRSTSEMSDGWIDAAIESGRRAANVQPTHPYETNVSSLIDDNEPFAPTSSFPPGAATTLTPLKPQNTNNPFLQRRSSGAAGEPLSPKLDRQHAEAWADLFPEAASHNSGFAGQTTASQGSRGHTSSPWEEQDQGAFIKGKGKGKEPMLDYLGLPNRQESGTLDQGQMLRPAIPQSVPEAEYAPPPGPPPQAQSEQEYAPPPGPPPQKNETYQIKHIRWVDNTNGDSTRTSPILMQNLNGPCPLLALVNALTLSTPRKTESSLVEALRTREQVSLGLLLDAVVEELISNHMSAQTELPDMVELYDFLRALHTGMNVNPAFVSSDEVPNLIDFDPGSPTSLRPTKAAGGFENTKELRLYSTFTIPLIHGWLSPRSHSAYAALERSARTHEDAENLLTREDELEEKLAKEGLSEDEQRLLGDIGAIKHFLTSSATQLTGYGLDTITDTMAPGSFAILFRNNHFSTLHKHSLTGSVFSLVTDMGYAKYPEIIWESLVDTNGLGSELFSGDFRTVTHGSNAPVSGDNEFSSQETGGEWSTVIRGGKTKQLSQPLAKAGASSQFEAQTSTNHEQEDADLALALQLQEEEEERHRRENPPPRAQTVRQLGPQGSRGNPVNQRNGPIVSPGSTPPRRLAVQTSGNTASNTSVASRTPRAPQPNNSPFQSNTGRRRPVPATNRADPDGPSDEPPPPSYEDALEETPYNPPADSQHHHASPVPSPLLPQRNSEGTPINFDELMARAERETPVTPGTRARQGSTTQLSAWNHVVAESSGGNRVHSGGPYADATRRRRGSSGQDVWPQESKTKDRDCLIM